MNIEKIIQILEHYGYKAQELKAIEELTELQAVLIQIINKGSNPVFLSELIGEIADVKIMLSQLELIFCIDPDELRDIIEYKIDRQIKRIENE